MLSYKLLLFAVAAAVLLSGANAAKEQEKGKGDRWAMSAPY
jgi:hypothetical protein